MQRGILFDVDGTLVDSVDAHARAWQRTLERFGHPMPFDEIRRLIGKGADQLLPGLMPPDELERIQKDLSAAKKELFAREYMPELEAFPSVRELFERVLAAGWKVALATSAAGDELQQLKQIAGIGDLIHEETSKDDAEESKPHPDIFRAALDRLGVLPGAALAVGDTPYDAEAARILEVKTIGLLCGGFPERSLREAGCIAVFEGPADLCLRYGESPLAAREVEDE